MFKVFTANDLIAYHKLVQANPHIAREIKAIFEAIDGGLAWTELRPEWILKAIEAIERSDLGEHEVVLATTSDIGCELEIDREQV